MRRARRVGRLLLLPAIGLAVAVAVAPNRAALEVHVWLLVVLGLALLAFVGLVTAAYPRTRSPFDASLVRRRPRWSALQPSHASSARSRWRGRPRSTSTSASARW